MGSNKFGRAFTTFVDSVSALSMLILTLIILLLVACRLLDISVSSISELPTYLLYMNVWMAAILNAQSADGHIALDFIGLIIKNPKFHQMTNIVLLLLAVLALCLFSYCTILEVANLMKRGIVTAGMQMPMWWVYAAVCFSALSMAFYNLRRLCLAIREVSKK
jgi:TRAP-type C4-dicarboxylate transport system permease small subunit